MVIEYNKITLQTKDANPDCEMRAVWGDLVVGKEPVDEAWAADTKFDIIAMSVSNSGSPSHTCLGRERERETDLFKASDRHLRLPRLRFYQTAEDFLKA